ncbi:MAG: oligoendopeptidase F [Parachlamydiales bacterium]|nr:oligoendopeptidase F [Parachlamydiales bacterium]
MVRLRNDVSKEDKWDIEKIFSSVQAWKEFFEKINPKDKKNAFLEVNKYKDILQKSSDNILKCLNNYFELSKKIEKLYIYAHLYLDQDLSNDEAKTLFGMISSLYNLFAAETSWIEPEILKIEEKTFQKFLKEESLKDFRFYLEKLYRLKPHTLTSDQEKILAKSEKCLNTPSLAFSMLNNADFKFENVKNSKGEEKILSHATYLTYLRSKDRTLRKDAFEKLHKQFSKYENTITELLAGSVKNSSFISETRNYNSSLQASLFPKNIDEEVYLNLIETVHKKIDSLHKFVKFKKEKLGLDKLHFYDVYASVVKDVSFNFEKDKAVNMVIDSVKPLGSEYQNALKKGLTEERWVDFFETKNKKSGAYSSGFYESYPYILMNYENSLNDVLTLAHECGHSMHSLLANQNQLYQYASYPIFLAEIASTFNEKLLMDNLFKSCKKEEEKKYLLCYQLDSIHATFFRQTLFAEFEYKIHKFEQDNIPITPNLLKTTYGDLYKLYYGEDFYVDDSLKVEFLRIPHFYSSFYVYQYAIGIASAFYFHKMINDDPSHKEKYLGFLKKGGSDYPLNILKSANVDLKKPQIIENLFDYFDDLLDKVDHL